MERMPPDAPQSGWLVAFALLATALIVLPIALVPPGAVTAVRLVAGVLVAVGTLVFVVARRGGLGADWIDRMTTASYVAIPLSFVVTASLTPPDPLTQLLYGGPAVGVALLAAHAAVALGADRAITARM